MNYLLLAAAMAGDPSAAYANCVPRADGERELLRAFGERPLMTGVARGEAVTLYANPETGTWTLVTRSPRSALSCAVAGGTGLEVEPAGEAS